MGGDRVMSEKYRLLEKPAIEESYDYAEQVRRQIERCLAASALEDKDIREATYAACVRALGTLIPIEDRDDGFKSELDKCGHFENQDVRPKYGGVRMNVDVCEKLGVPTFKEVTITNWDQYFEILFNKFIALRVVVRRGSYAA